MVRRSITRKSSCFPGAGPGGTCQPGTLESVIALPSQAPPRLHPNMEPDVLLDHASLLSCPLARTFRPHISWPSRPLYMTGMSPSRARFGRPSTLMRQFWSRLDAFRQLVTIRFIASVDRSRFPHTAHCDSRHCHVQEKKKDWAGPSACHQAAVLWMSEWRRRTMLLGSSSRHLRAPGRWLTGSEEICSTVMVRSTATAPNVPATSSD